MIQVIAEIGWNHGGDMKLAKEMIKAAADNGADFAKFQTWSVDRLKPGSWDEDGRRQIYEKAELSKTDHMQLIQYCNEVDIEFMSSVFSIEDAKLLVELDVDNVKIPSFESRNHELITYCNNNFPHIFMSVGTSTWDEIDDSASLIYGDTHLSLMHCVSSYPCNPGIANIPRMVNLINENLPYRNTKIGYSDHIQGVESAKVAIGAGAQIIEKHFTTHQDLPGRDNKFAILPHELKDLTDYIRLRDKMLVDLGNDYQKCEQDSRDNYTGRFNG